MQRFKNYFTEASILKPDYVVGHKFVYNGKGIKEFANAGYKEGDVFEIVSATKGAIQIGKDDGTAEKYLKGPDNKVYLFRGGFGFKASSFTHLKTEGDAPSGAEWEDLIVYGYNNINERPTDPETIKVAQKYWGMYEDKAMAIANNFNKSLKSNQLVQTGRGMGKISLGKHWVEAGAKNKTPKTDIASSDFKEKISLKKEGGSQLASAEKKEAIAIVNAALETMGADSKFSANLIKTIEEKMTKLVSTEAVTSLNRRSKAGDTDSAVIDFQKKDRSNKELTDMLASYLNQNTEANSTFSRHIVWEAATGNSKFGTPASKAAANLLGKFSVEGEVELKDISRPDSPLIVEYSKKVRPYVAFKKGSGNSPAHSALRLGLKEETETFADIVFSEAAEIPGVFLTEELLQEGPMDVLRKLRRLGGAIASKVKSAIKNIITRVSKTLRKIASLGRQMFASLMKFLGVEIQSANGIVSEISL